MSVQDSSRPESSPEQKFFSWESASRDTIEVKRCYIDVAGGDLARGILLSQIIYWFLPQKGTDRSKTTVVRDGRRWIAKTSDAWWDECRIPQGTVRRHLEKLQDDGLITLAVWKFNGSPTTHISLNVAHLLKRLVFAFSQNGSAQYEQNGSEQNEQMEMLNMSRTYKEAETTAETTSENTNTSLASRDKNPSQQNGVFELPLITGEAYQVPEDLYREYVKTYQAINVMSELAKMRAWLISNPKNRKTKKGIPRFMNTWLSRAQDRAPRRDDGQQAGRNFAGLDKGIQRQYAADTASRLAKEYDDSRFSEEAEVGHRHDDAPLLNAEDIP